MQLTADYDVVQKKLSQIEAELKTVTGFYNNSNANQGLTLFKTKVEKDLAAVTRDYNDIARGVKLADDRANKASPGAGHFESLLREEQTKLMKITNAKAALEKQVHSLSVKIEEIETNSVTTSKGAIEKMGIRIIELEEIINVEKKSHAATMTEMQIKTRQIKRQLGKQEGISNANIMRVKKFSAENRAEEAESTLNQFRSMERLFAAASIRNEKSTEVVVKKIINKVYVGTASSSSAMQFSRSALQTFSDFRAGSTFSRAGSVTRGSTFSSGEICYKGCPKWKDT